MATLKVLIVDDEPGIRSGIVRTLRDFAVNFPFLDEEFNFEPIEIETGEKAIEFLTTEKADIVLLDNKLPGIDGIEVLEYINKNELDCNVMMITSYASLDLAIKATNNGAYNFVPKPFTPQELKTSIAGITKNLYLRRMTKQMNTEGKQLRFQFLSMLSHELKSPLNAIEGYLNIMEDKQLGDGIEDYMTMIHRSLERIKGMRTLIMDMLDLTRLESGKKHGDVQKVDLVEVMRITRETMMPIAIRKDIKIEIDANPKEIFYLADKQEMEIVFNNLVSNAVKYNKDGGTVKCILREEQDGVKIAVQDTGIGLTQEDASKLFQEFVRIKNEKTKAISGSGLGLSITKKIVKEVYHGVITVKSVPDQGSIFTVVLPKITA